MARSTDRFCSSRRSGTAPTSGALRNRFRPRGSLFDPHRIGCGFIMDSRSQSGRMARRVRISCGRRLRIARRHHQAGCRAGAAQTMVRRPYLRLHWSWSSCRLLVVSLGSFGHRWRACFRAIDSRSTPDNSVDRGRASDRCQPHFSGRALSQRRDRRFLYRDRLSVGDRCLLARKWHFTRPSIVFATGIDLPLVFVTGIDLPLPRSR